MKILRRIGYFLFLFIVLPMLVSYVTRPFMNEWQSNNELSASGYAVIAKEYPTLSLSAQSVIDQHMSKGYLIQKDSQSIYDAMLKDRPGGIMVSPSPDFGDPPEAIHLTVYRNIVGQPTKSKAKDLLLNYSYRKNI
jgi:hypothetical protein